jgi:GTPase
MEDTLRDDAANALIEKCGYAAAALGLLPLPGTEIIAVMPLHVGMVVALGDLYEVPLSRESAAELLMQIGGTVGVSVIGSRLAMTAAKTLLPGFGGLVTAPLLYGTTLGLGAVARAWFECGGRLDPGSMRRTYKSAKRRARFDGRKAEATPSEEPPAAEESTTSSSP